MLKKILNSELSRGAIILFITINIFNFLNFVFHFAMGRMLGPKDYGILAVLVSLFYIYSIPVEAIQTLIARHSTTLNARKEYGKIKYLMIKSLKKGFVFASFIFPILIPISFLLAKFLDINIWFILLTNTFIFIAFSSPITRGVLQGRKKFGLFGTSLVFESIVKISFSVLFVLLGMKVFGALIGALMGGFMGIILLFYFNLDLFKFKKREVKFKEIYYQSLPYFFVTIVIYLILSLDILLAKRFFAPEIVGKYSVLSMLGKMIFLGTSSMAKTMFPLTSEKKDNGENPKKLFIKSFLIVGVLCLMAVGIFALIPKLIIWILYGSAYVDVSSFLIYSGIAFSFLALSNLVLIYGLSINKLKYYYLLFGFIILEVILLSIFNNNLYEYVLAFMFSNIVMFIGSLFLVRK